MKTMGTLDRKRLGPMAQQLGLLFGTLLLCFFVTEISVRILDPFPYFTDDEINDTKQGYLSEYDPTLGWKGVPGGKARFVTKDADVWLAYNRQGFRDIEHNYVSDQRPGMVFLGDSFTWGMDVELEEIFVNRLRSRVPGFKIFNLGHRGYGTDQELLTLQHWPYNGALEWVFLMFYENDVKDNNSIIRYRLPKPKFQVFENGLVLTGVPVPKWNVWSDTHRKERTPMPFIKKLGIPFLQHSHLLHHVYFRYSLWSSKDPNEYWKAHSQNEDTTLTFLLLRELKKEVERRGARLAVFFIPHKAEIEQLGNVTPYQIEIAEFCHDLDIEYLDLAESFKATWYRTYHRKGIHWNSHGHQVAAEAIYDFLMGHGIV